MAYSAITAGQIASGQPTAQELFTKTKDNFIDHETRISDLEASATSTNPLVFTVQGMAPVVDELSIIRVPYGITVTGVKLFVWQAGVSGTVTVDVERKVGAGAWSTILTGTIASAFGAGDYDLVNAAGIAISALTAGTFLRLNIDSMQAGLSGFQVIVEYTVTV